MEQPIIQTVESVSHQKHIRLLPHTACIAFLCASIYGYFMSFIYFYRRLKSNL